MENMRNKYIFAPFDKAANNVIAIYQLYYGDALNCF